MAMQGEGDQALVSGETLRCIRRAAQIKRLEARASDSNGHECFLCEPRTIIKIKCGQVRATCRERLDAHIADVLAVGNREGAQLMTIRSKNE
eukprot:scaffold146101_cov34-Tisochrysis_lutea.AAC.2